VAAKNISGAVATIKPGGLREMHWHPNASEWQYYISGKGRMTIVLPDGARTMDFNANDVGYVPRVVGHYVENTGDTDLVVLEMFATGDFQEISLNNWIRRLPPEMVTAHLKLDSNDISKISADAGVFILPR
jgi:oxalate decarboxylase